MSTVHDRHAESNLDVQPLMIDRAYIRTGKWNEMEWMLIQHMVVWTTAIEVAYYEYTK